jgi:hypothetical protein
MAQPAPPQRTQGHPSFGHWLFHVRKTTRLYGTLLHDPRVALWRKIFFVGAIIVFGIVLIIPDSIIIGALSLLLPVAGPAFGIPAGITADVAALAIVLYAFLRIFFPRQIVHEHAVELYGPYPDIRPHTMNQTTPGALPDAAHGAGVTSAAGTMVAAPPRRQRSGGRVVAWLLFALIVLGGAAWFLIHNNMIHI